MAGGSALQQVCAAGVLHQQKEQQHAHRCLTMHCLSQQQLDQLQQKCCQLSPLLPVQLWTVWQCHQAGCQAPSCCLPADPHHHLQSAPHAAACCGGMHGQAPHHHPAAAPPTRHSAAALLLLPLPALQVGVSAVSCCWCWCRLLALQRPQGTSKQWPAAPAAAAVPPLAPPIHSVRRTRHPSRHPRGCHLVPAHAAAAAACVRHVTGALAPYCCCWCSQWRCSQLQSWQVLLQLLSLTLNRLSLCLLLLFQPGRC